MQQVKVEKLNNTNAILYFLSRKFSFFKSQICTVAKRTRKYNWEYVYFVQMLIFT